MQVKWQFPFQLAGMGTFENLSRSPACFRKFPVDPHVLFAFQPVKPKLLESALGHTVMSVIRDSLVLAFGPASKKGLDICRRCQVLVVIHPTRRGPKNGFRRQEFRT